MEKQTTFSKIKKGEFFKFVGKKTVYIFEGGKKNFSYSKFDDMNARFTTKTDRAVIIGFTF